MSPVPVAMSRSRPLRGSPHCSTAYRRHKTKRRLLSTQEAALEYSALAISWAGGTGAKIAAPRLGNPSMLICRHHTTFLLIRQSLCIRQETDHEDTKFFRIEAELTRGLSSAAMESRPTLTSAIRRAVFHTCRFARQLHV